MDLSFAISLAIYFSFEKKESKKEKDEEREDEEEREENLTTGEREYNNCAKEGEWRQRTKASTSSCVT